MSWNHKSTTQSGAGARVLLACVCVLLSLVTAPRAPGGQPYPPAIVLPEKASPLEQLAAREAQRYLYLTTGRLLPINSADTLPDKADLFVVARKDRPMTSPAGLSGDGAAQGYSLKTVRQGGRRVLFVAGNDDLGTLYAAYRLAEVLGVRFYLHGDSVPDHRAAFALPDLNEQARPLFALRGILPFHDFPEGPDWWNSDEYLAVIGQLPKLRMNFIGLHNYPEGRKEFRTEPGVWIGQPSDIGRHAKVKFSYPAAYHNTLRGTWGYEPRTSTAEFACGAALLFNGPVFGSDISRRHAPLPVTLRQCNDVFKRTGALLNQAFAFAGAMGVKTCIGTETPLRIPAELRQRLRAQGNDTNNPVVIEGLYEGIFRRIAQTYPLDYYWLWTPESWTWEGEDAAQIAAATNDFARAIAALKKAAVPFRLATCGWVLGPRSNRALFDTVLPREITLSCINRRTGLDPLDDAFSRIQHRSKWAIPWLEDDGAFLSAQLWAGRLRRDAVDALEAGCDGLMGIHWRTRVIGPNVAALAHAAWEQQPWKRTISPAERAATPEGRWALGPCQPADDLYADWAAHEFGECVGPDAAAIFAQLDGRLPRSSDWVRNGPGGLAPNPQPWESIRPRYDFLERLRALRPRLDGPGNLARFEYWLDTFEFMRASDLVCCTWAAYNQAIGVVKAAGDTTRQRELARDLALPIRRQLISQLTQLYRHLLATVSTTGEMGTVANLESHTLPELLLRPGRELEILLGGKLPPDALLPGTYDGPTRIIVPALRGSLNQGTRLDLKIIVLGKRPPSLARLCWRKLGAGTFRQVPLAHQGAGIYSASIPAWAARGTGSFEYYLEVNDPTGQPVRFPPTAPALNQTVVVLPW